MSFDTMSYNTPSPLSSPRNSGCTDDDDFNLLMEDDDMEDDEDVSADSILLPSSDPEIKKRGHSSISNSAAKKLGDSSTHAHSTSSSKFSDKIINTNSANAARKKIYDPVIHQRTIGAYTPNARKIRLQKFHEKRKKRIWKKSIKYDCRKKLADDRPRIKGRFVRVLEHLQVKTDASATVTPPVVLPTGCKQEVTNEDLGVLNTVPGVVGIIGLNQTSGIPIASQVALAQ